MALTTEKSTQVTSQTAVGPSLLSPIDLGGRIRIAFFDFTQGAAAGDANSTMDLVRLPAGRLRILQRLSYIAWSAFGAGRTLNIGHTGFTDIDGASVAAAADVVDDGRDVSSAGSDYLGDGTNGVDALAVSSQSLITIQGIVLGATIPAAATLNGWLAFVVD